MNRGAIYQQINAERARQQAKWGGPHDWGEGDCSSPHVEETTKLCVLSEEVGEVSRALLDGNKADLRAELVQVAAVAVAWLEGID